MADLQGVLEQAAGVAREALEAADKAVQKQTKQQQEHQTKLQQTKLQQQTKQQQQTKRQLTKLRNRRQS